MEKSNVIEFEGRSENPLTELLRSGARQLLQQAIKTEVQELLAAHSDRTLADGRAGVVRNGYQPERAIQTGIGPLTVNIPKVRAKTGEPVTFRSARVPPYVRKTQSLEAALLWLYLKGVSSGEMSAALEGGPGWSGGPGFVGQHGIAVEAQLGAGIPSVARSATGQGALGLCVGRRRLMSGARSTFWRLRTGFGNRPGAGVRRC